MTLPPGLRSWRQVFNLPMLEHPVPWEYSATTTSVARGRRARRERSRQRAKNPRRAGDGVGPGSSAGGGSSGDPLVGGAAQIERPRRGGHSGGRRQDRGSERLVRRRLRERG